jgi:arabinoxylan arabinofuranohydrolase
MNKASLLTLAPMLLMQAALGQMIEKTYNNPIIVNRGVCDPHIHIFNNKAYLFATHDDGVGHDFYVMNDWWLWSSPDLVHWNLDYTLKPEAMYVGPTKNAWAVDGAERNGTYYWYVSANWKTAVATSKAGPQGPYADALGKPLTDNYDPTIFIDDDANKTPYIITGGYPYKISKLNNDMLSLAEQPKNLIHTDSGWNGDGGFLHKRNGIYYLNGHGCGYATATNIYGPYKYRGKFIQDWVDHPTVFTWNNQTFCTFGAGDGDPFYRKTLITYIHYKANGDIVGDVEMIKSITGVGQYDCTKPIQAEWYFAASDGITKSEVGNGFAISNTLNDSYLHYPRLLNVAENPTLNLSIASTATNGSIEVHEDSKTGTLLGTITVPNTGSLTNYVNASAKLTCASGLKNIFLVFKGTGNVANIDFITISASGAIPIHPDFTQKLKAAVPTPNSNSVNAFQKIEAESNIGSVGTGSEICTDVDGGKHLGYIKHFSNIVFNLDFGTEAAKSRTFQARVSSGVPKGGTIELHLDSGTGPLLGSVSVSNTGGWGTWVTKEGDIGPVSGKHLVYLVFVGLPEEDVYLLNLNWIQFTPGTVSISEVNRGSANRTTLDGAAVRYNPYGGAPGVTFVNLMPSSRVEIQTISGNIIARCASKEDGAGTLVWDGKTLSGSLAAPGMHIGKISSGSQTKILKIMLPR